MNLSVTFLDCLVVMVIIVSAGYAAWRGFLSETLSIFAWVAAAFACLYFGPYIVPLTHSLIAIGWIASLVGYAAVFLAVFIPLSFMSHRFSESVKNSPIGPLDRALGVAFGVVRGLVLVGLAYLAFTYVVPIREHPRWLTDARLLPVIQNTSETLLSLVPERGWHGFARSEPRGTEPEPRHDPLAELIRRNREANRAPPAARPSVQHKRAPAVQKRYGAGERQALDRLIEATGNGGTEKP
jgi:membrane protein required for colicin V production